MTLISNIDGKIWLALKGHMDTWSETDIYYSPDIPQKPGVSDPYLVVTDMRLDIPTRLMGATDSDEYRGVLNVSVMVPIGWTAAQAMGLTGRVADHWPKVDWLVYDDCRVMIHRRPRVIGVGYVDHGMMRYQVQVSWRAVG